MSFKNRWMISSGYDFQAHQQCSQRWSRFSQTAIHWFKVLPGFSPALPDAPRLVVGAPRTVVGAPRTVVGTPSLVVGAPSLVIGAPRTVVGAHSLVVGASRLVVGAPRLVVGAPRLVVGASRPVASTPRLVASTPMCSQVHPKFSLALRSVPKLITIICLVLLFQSSEIPVTLKTGRNALLRSNTLLQLMLQSLHSISSQTLLDASSDQNTFCWCIFTKKL